MVLVYMKKKYICYHQRFLFKFKNKKLNCFHFLQIDPTKQQDEHWLFGQIGNDKQGFFPAAYAEPIM